jgi:DNA invertase Pin-like site-specific DNA recombinase
MNGVAYVRVSTGEQAESGAGLAAQAAAIEAFAARSGITIVGRFEDAGLSGAAGIEDRPGLAAAIGALRRGDVLLVAKRDRLGRDVMLTMTIERTVGRRGASIVSADGIGNGDGAADQFMRTVMDAAAQFERGLIRARTKAAMSAKRRAGERVGELPFGWTLGLDGKLEPVAEEQEVIARIEALRADGMSYRAIAQVLTAAGITTKKGVTAWKHTTVRSILQRQAAVAA